MDTRTAVDRLIAKYAELSKGLALDWRYAPAPPANPVRSGDKRGWERWNREQPAPFRKNGKNWFRAELTFPADMHGLPLRGARAFIYIHGYCPFTLWLDGREMFREEHVWYASGPIADPVVAAIEPGRRHTLVVCFEPTEVPWKFDPLHILVVPLPCVEAGVDTLATASELSLADALARTPDEKRRVEHAAALLDLASLGRSRWDAFSASVARMEDMLAPFAPRARALTVHLIGHTHIDMDWQWTWKDTVNCIRRDYKATLGVMRDHPEVTFSMSQIPTYDVIRRQDPDLFRQVREHIRTGRWENLASTWVEGDLNMADGEAIARHMLYAADWSRQHLGAQAKVFWAPDTFGHPGNMPQLAALGECDTYFHWRCNPGAHENWPVRFWRGIDGTEMLAFSSAYGAGALLPGPHMYMLLHNALRYLAFGITQAHHVWGLGDHGGGLPRHQLALLERYRHRPLMPRFRFSTLRELRRAVLRQRDRIPRNTGETYLLFEGCFTTHAQVKAWNRRCEGALLAAEALAALGGLDRTRALRDAWTPVLFTQFHDIFDGCAVPDSYRDASRRARRSVGVAHRVTREAAARLAGPARRGPQLSLLNPLGHARTEIVAATLPASVHALADTDGRIAPVQRFAGQAVFLASGIPAFGRKDLRIATRPRAAGHAAEVEVTQDANYFTIETAHARCRLSKASGAIGSYWDKRLGRELVGYGVPKFLQHVDATRADLALNVFEVCDEADNRMPAWLMNDIVRRECLLHGAQVRLVETGPVFARFGVRHRFRSSRIEQDLLFYRDVPRVEFVTTIRWQEQGSPKAGIPELRLSFAAAMSAARAHSEGPYVVREAPADGLERVTQKWVDLTGDEFGFTLYNDARYGFAALGGKLEMTLLRGSYSPDPESDRGVHVVRLAFEPHGPHFDPAATLRAGMAFNRPVVAVCRAGRSRGAVPQLTLDGSDTVVCTALRRAEHSDGLLVRLFECGGKRARARIRLGRGIVTACEVNLLENPRGRILAPRDGAVTAVFRPYEVKTLLVRVAGWA